MARIYLTNGTRVTRGTFPSTPVVDTDPPVRLTATVLVRRPYDKAKDGERFEDQSLQVLHPAGTVLRTSQVDALFPPATAATGGISPATGPAAGGTVVTITGTNLDGVTAVTFGGTPGTALTVVSGTQLQVTTPAHAAGAVNVVLTDDSGTTQVTNGYTYA